MKHLKLFMIGISVFFIVCGCGGGGGGGSSSSSPTYSSFSISGTVSGDVKQCENYLK